MTVVCYICGEEIKDNRPWWDNKSYVPEITQPVHNLCLLRDGSLNSVFDKIHKDCYKCKICGHINYARNGCDAKKIDEEHLKYHEGLKNVKSV